MLPPRLNDVVSLFGNVSFGTVSRFGGGGATVFAAALSGFGAVAGAFVVVSVDAGFAVSVGDCSECWVNVARAIESARAAAARRAARSRRARRAAAESAAAAAVTESGSGTTDENTAPPAESTTVVDADCVADVDATGTGALEAPDADGVSVIDAVGVAVALSGNGAAR